MSASESVERNSARLPGDHGGRIDQGLSEEETRAASMQSRLRRSQSCSADRSRTESETGGVAGNFVESGEDGPDGRSDAVSNRLECVQIEPLHLGGVERDHSNNLVRIDSSERVRKRLSRVRERSLFLLGLDVVRGLEGVGDPTRTGLGEDEPELREAVEHAGDDQRPEWAMGIEERSEGEQRQGRGQEVIDR